MRRILLSIIFSLTLSACSANNDVFAPYNTAIEASVGATMAMYGPESGPSRRVATLERSYRGEIERGPHGLFLLRDGAANRRRNIAFCNAAQEYLIPSTSSALAGVPTVPTLWIDRRTAGNHEIQDCAEMVDHYDYDTAKIYLQSLRVNCPGRRCLDVSDGPVVLAFSSPHLMIYAIDLSGHSDAELRDCFMKTWASEIVKKPEDWHCDAFSLNRVKHTMSAAAGYVGGVVFALISLI